MNDINQEIFVTRPALPPLIELIPSLELIWNNRILTNNGPFHGYLEAGLCEYLGVKHVSLFANATIALVTAMKALAIKGEVITTPFSFVATSHALMWNGITPVFVDIDIGTYNINVDNLKSAISNKTKAIVILSKILLKLNKTVKRFHEKKGLCINWFFQKR